MVKLEEKYLHVSRKRGGKGITYPTLQILPSGKTILPEPYLLFFLNQSLPYFQQGKYPTTAPSSHLAQPVGGK
jgi:hypothetical protein